MHLRNHLWSVYFAVRYISFTFWLKDECSICSTLNALWAREQVEFLSSLWEISSSKMPLIHQRAIRMKNSIMCECLIHMMRHRALPLGDRCGLQSDYQKCNIAFWEDWLSLFLCELWRQEAVIKMLQSSSRWYSVAWRFGSSTADEALAFLCQELNPGVWGVDGGTEEKR